MAQRPPPPCAVIRLSAPDRTGRSRRIGQCAPVRVPACWAGRSRSAAPPRPPSGRVEPPGEQPLPYGGGPLGASPGEALPAIGALRVHRLVGAGAAIDGIDPEREERVAAGRQQPRSVLA